ncbi:hypothetical protein ME805_09340 [Lactobacillus delbrueckii]|nr:hypothetical protein ME805_09340 [Lactobacillus delbrueckii]
MRTVLYCVATVYTTADCLVKYDKKGVCIILSIIPNNPSSIPIRLIYNTNAS